MHVSERDVAAARWGLTAGATKDFLNATLPAKPGGSCAGAGTGAICGVPVIVLLLLAIAVRPRRRRHRRRRRRRPACQT